MIGSHAATKQPRRLASSVCRVQTFPGLSVIPHPAKPTPIADTHTNATPHNTQTNHPSQHHKRHKHPRSPSAIICCSLQPSCSLFQPDQHSNNRSTTPQGHRSVCEDAPAAVSPNNCAVGKKTVAAAGGHNQTRRNEPESGQGGARSRLQDAVSLTQCLEDSPLRRCVVLSPCPRRD